MLLEEVGEKEHLQDDDNNQLDDDDGAEYVSQFHRLNGFVRTKIGIIP
jgi:hypothetical protein